MAGLVVRRMADPEFRQAQWDQRYAPHIAPVNKLVDRLRVDGRGPVPYVAPMYGGTDARLLSVLRDPGPMTQDERGGSGLLCMQNNDATAERLVRLFGSVGISPKDIVPWNAYPWYINTAPTAAQLDAGVDPLTALIGLMPHLRVIMLHGLSAQSGWRRLSRRNPAVLNAKVLVISTYHPSRQAFWHRDPSVREQRAAHLADAFRQASETLGRNQ
jgi:hypothetical protein